MMKRRLIYLAAVSACIWLIMLYTFQGLRFLLGILLVLPAVCLLFLLVRLPGCRVEMKEVPAYVARGERIMLPVTVVCRGFLPVTRLCVRLGWTFDGVRKKPVRREIRGVEAGSEQELFFEFTAKHCGQARFWVAKARINDSLGLFSLPVRAGGASSLFITPVIFPLPEQEAAFLLRYLRLCEMWEDGDYFVREYRPGDSPRSIHWKLTAKEDDLLVRDFQPEGSVNLFLHMTDALLAEKENRDTFLDKACSLMAFLTQQTTAGFDVGWMRDGVLCRYRINTGKDIFLCARELLEVKRTGETLPEEALELMQGCRLEPDGRLYLGEQCAYEE
ncbi:MAG: DUF58 domain-containing protein [bacterium]|nr:DUF58 domain-containing protein [bacterium]